MLSAAWLAALAVVTSVDVVSAAPNNLSKVGSVVAQIEALDCLNKTFQVLGLQIRAADDFALATLCESPSDDSLRYAAIAVSKDSDGVLVATNLSSIGALYIPGVSQVYLSGEVTESKKDVGSFAVLGSRAIFSDQLTPKIHEQIEVVGTQPQFGGAIVATTVSSPSYSESAGQANSIIGTGIQADSIIGTGVSRLSIIGTGVSAKSIIGTGASTSSIIGTGINSVTGTGVSASSIIGTGASTSSIIGTGVQANLSIGTGVSTSSIIGTGIQTDSIIGTGTL